MVGRWEAEDDADEADPEHGHCCYRLGGSPEVKGAFEEIGWI